MFIEKGMKIRAITKHGLSYTGTIMDLAIQPCEDDHNRPHALLIITQDYKYVEIEGEFEHVTLWVEKLEQIEVYNEAEPLPHNEKILPIRDILFQKLEKIIDIETNEINFYVIDVLSDTDNPNIASICGEIDVTHNSKSYIGFYTFRIRRNETDRDLSHIECKINFQNKYELKS